MGSVLAGWAVAALAAMVAFCVLRRRRRGLAVPPEVRTFVRLLEEELRAHPDVELRGMIPGRFAAVLSIRGQELPVSLHHLFERSVAFPETFARTVAAFVADLLERGLDHASEHWFADVATSILPQIRSREWLRAHGSVFGDGALVHRPLTDDLVICYVLDDPWCMTFVCRAHLQQWGHTEEDLFHLATRNLHRLAGAALPLPGPGEEAVLVRSGDGFDAARVLLLDQEKGEGLLVALPDRDVLWLGLPDGEDIERLMVLNRQQSEAGTHPLSPQLFRMTGGELVPVKAPGSGS